MTDADKIHLSVVIPTLDKVETARFLAARVRELLPSLSVEAVIVTPCRTESDASDSMTHYVRDAGRGVYAAYTQGLQIARGEYVWFMGDDDYPLEGIRTLSHLIRDAAADLLVAPVIFSNGRLFRQTRSRFLLHFLNWCQQGVIYRRAALARHRFYRRLTVQADQYVNILLRSDPGVTCVFAKTPVCVFGVEGVSSRVRDRGYRSLRSALAHRTLGNGEFLLFRLLTKLEPLVKRWFAIWLVRRGAVK